MGEVQYVRGLFDVGATPARRTWGEDHEVVWQEQQDADPVPLAPSAPALETKNAPPTPKKDTPPNKRRDEFPALVPDDAKRQKLDDRKRQDSLFAKAKALKSRLDVVQSKYLTLKEPIESSTEWGWAKSDSLQGPVIASRKAIEDFKTSSEFWRLWSISPAASFATQVRKTLAATDIDKECQHLPSLDNHLEQFEGAVSKVYNMKLAINL